MFASLKSKFAAASPFVVSFCATAGITFCVGYTAGTLLLHHNVTRAKTGIRKELDRIPLPNPVVALSAQKMLDCGVSTLERTKTNILSATFADSTPDSQAEASDMAARLQTPVTTPFFITAQQSNITTGVIQSALQTYIKLYPQVPVFRILDTRLEEAALRFLAETAAFAARHDVTPSEMIVQGGPAALHLVRLVEIKKGFLVKDFFSSVAGMEVLNMFLSLQKVANVTPDEMFLAGEKILRLALFRQEHVFGTQPPGRAVPAVIWVDGMFFIFYSF